MKNKVYLRYQNDYLINAVAYRSKSRAIAAFRAVASELAQYEQYIEAAIHYAANIDELDEYPDFVLVLGPRGGVSVTAA